MTLKPLVILNCTKATNEMAYSNLINVENRDKHVRLLIKRWTVNLNMFFLSSRKRTPEMKSHSSLNLVI